jgi:LPXTG-motif cell wall-anchored protein
MMSAEPTKRRGVAWQLAVGTVGLSVTLGGGVLGAGAAAAETVWTGPAIEDAFSCGGDVFLTFSPDARDAAEDVTYWVRTAPGTPQTGGESSTGDSGTGDSGTGTEGTGGSGTEGTGTEGTGTTGTEGTGTGTTGTEGTGTGTVSSPAIAGAEAPDVWTQLQVEQDGDYLVALVDGLAVDSYYNFSIQARVGTEQSEPGAVDLVLVEDTACPITGDTGGETGGNTGGNTGGETGGNTGGETGGNTGGNTGTEAPVVVPPATTVPDNGGTPRMNVPVVPATVPDAPLTLTTDKGQITTVAPGEKVTIIGDGFKPGSTATIIIYSEPQVLETVLVGPDGSFRVEIEVPAGLPAGQHSLVASGIAPDGSERFIRMNVTVDADGTATIDGNGDGVDDTLAYTGAEPLVPALLGAGALVGGGALLFVSRRRRAAQV